MASKTPVRWSRVALINSDPNNARRPTDRGMEVLIESITRFGQQKPIVIDADRVCIAGNKTLEAVKRAGKKRVLVIETALSGPDAAAYAIVDNRSAELSEWDPQILPSSLEELEGFGYPSESLGFGPAELKSALEELARRGSGPGGSSGEVEEDKPPEPPADPITQPGDLWILGDHRLVCGDCTEAEVFALGLDGGTADAFITDPPYGVSYASKQAHLNALDGGDRVEDEIAHDHESVEDMSSLWVAAFSASCEATKPGGCYYVTCANMDDLLLRIMESLRDSGWLLKHMLIWAKNNHVLGRCDYNYKHEPILYGWKPGAGHYFGKEGPATSLWEFDRPNQSKLHPTMKPVALIAAMVANGSKHGEIILDPFSGSGTTLIACEQINRRCAAIEISPAYCDVIVRRWEELTGKTAERQSANEP